MKTCMPGIWSTLNTLVILSLFIIYKMISGKWAHLQYHDFYNWMGYILSLIQDRLPLYHFLGL